MSTPALTPVELAVLRVLASSRTGPSSPSSIYRELLDDPTEAINAAIEKLVSLGLAQEAPSLKIGNEVIRRFAVLPAGTAYLQAHP